MFSAVTGDLLPKTEIFRLFRLRFTFLARQSLAFPPGKATNIIRGALGLRLREVSCAPSCSSAANCSQVGSCAYARLFEPRQTTGPSGFQDAPRPFVLRAAWLDGVIVPPGQTFCVDLHLFDLDATFINALHRAFARLAETGLGPRRGSAELLRVAPLAQDHQPIDKLIPVDFDLSHPGFVTTRVSLEFITPTELKGWDHQSGSLAIDFLMARLIERASNLTRLYQGAQLDLDSATLRAAARSTRTLHSDFRFVDVERRSSRTGQTHPLSGVTGSVAYQGDMTSLLPLLHLGQFTGVGRQTVWGKGQYRLGLPEASAP